MCSIIGYCGKPFRYKDFSDGFAPTVSRGPDDTQIITAGQPFTKESLLYREIFEKNYPGQGEMIVDFWMPNKDWEGCNVTDPSARVLSNYGASGK